MLERISNELHRISTGAVTLAVLAVFLLLTALVLPAQSFSFTDVEGIGSPDTSFFYTPEELYRMAEAYGAEGRAAYLHARVTFDLMWPLVYTAFLVTAVSWLTRRAFAPASLWQRANLVPVLGGLLDYLENLTASIVMLRYPTRTAVVDVLAPVFTATKWLAGAASSVLLILAAIAVLRQRAGGKSRHE